MAMNIMEAITPEMGCRAVLRVRHFSKKALKNNGAPNKKSGAEAPPHSAKRFARYTSASTAATRRTRNGD
jgi:hypothetical protein